MPFYWHNGNVVACDTLPVLTSCTNAATPGKCLFQPVGMLISFVKEPDNTVMR